MDSCLDPVYFLFARQLLKSGLENSSEQYLSCHIYTPKACNCDLSRHQAARISHLCLLNISSCSLMCVKCISKAGVQRRVGVR
jgi:hypothetical protein